MQYTIDLSRVRTKKGLHRVLSRALPFPDYYGGNLDALSDVLSDPHELWSITFLGTEKARAQLGEYFDAFVRVLSEAQADGAAVTAEYR